MFKRKIAAAASAGALALTVGGFAVTHVSAQTPPPTAPQTSPAKAFLDKVARNLGVDEAKVEAAIKQAELLTVDERQQAGKLTPEQAQKLKDRINTSPGILPGALGERARDRIAKGYRFEVGEAARVIGVSEDQLRTELKSGKSLAEVAAAHNVSRDQLVEKLSDATNQRIDQAVRDNKLTADQAKKLEAHTRDRVSKAVDAKPRAR
jgi:ribosomal protein S13